MSQSDQTRSSALLMRGLLYSSLFLVPFIPGLLAATVGLRLLLRRERYTLFAALIGFSGICSVLLWAVVLVVATRELRDSIYRGTCASNAVELQRLLDEYASEHSGRYPRTVEELYRAQSIPQGWLYCRSQNDATGMDTRAFPFVYHAPSADQIGQRDFVVAHEPLSNHEGRGAVFLFADGRVEWLDLGPAESAVASRLRLLEESAKPEEPRQR